MRSASLVLLALFLAVAPAEARGRHGGRWGHGQGHGQNLRDVHVQFASMSARVDGDWLAIDYAADPTSWYWWQQDGGAATLWVEAWTANGQRSFQAPLQQGQGTAWFSLGGVGGLSNVVVSLGGTGRTMRAVSMFLPQGEYRRLMLPLAPPRWAASPNAIESCGSAFDGPTNEGACLQTLNGVRFEPSNLIAACEQAMDGDANELECLRAGVAAWSDPSARLTTCEQLMDGDQGELDCLRVVVNAAYEPSNAMRACEQAMDGDANELACIRSVVAAPFDPTATITACEQAMDGDASELECVQRALGQR